MVVVEQPAEAFLAKNAGVRVRGLWSTIDQEVLEALMISFPMIVLDELGDHVPKMSLSERDDPVEALDLDRKDEPLSEGVEIGTSRRSDT